MKTGQEGGGHWTKGELGLTSSVSFCDIIPHIRLFLDNHAFIQLLFATFPTYIFIPRVVSLQI